MLFRVVNIVMALNFLFSAAVQFNDPDPIQWIVVYGLASLVTAAAAVSPTAYRWYVSALVGVAALLWALTLTPHIWGRFTIPDLFRSWEMKAPVVEEARETLGLAIVAVWMLVLTILRRRAGPKVGSAQA